MTRKAFLTFWLISLVPLLLMGGLIALVINGTLGGNVTLLIAAALSIAILAAILVWFSVKWLLKPLWSIHQTAQDIAQETTRYADDDRLAQNGKTAAKQEPLTSLSQTLSQIGNQVAGLQQTFRKLRRNSHRKPALESWLTRPPNRPCKLASSILAVPMVLFTGSPDKPRPAASTSARQQ